MNYSLHVRALLSIVRKDKATAHAQRLFPGLPITCAGRYWKDDSLWEFTASASWEFASDQTALWETLKYFNEVHSQQWNVQFVPESCYEVLVWGIAENNVNNGWTWCNFELRRPTIEIVSSGS